ncbi:MAG: 30S ribosomal protein S14 [Rhodobacteraceae bacterium]|nr:30S ribosomal protein S14 [Paracoccaceae bacterium]
MAKKSMVERERKRQRMVKKYAHARAELKVMIQNGELPMDERFKASLKLAKLPRNSSATRLHNRCQRTGRPRGFYRKLQISRIAVRELGGSGQIPGMVKSSW